MATSKKNLDQQIESIRAFNRFYTKQIGLLDERLLNSKYTLTEVRVLYELVQSKGLTATDIKKELCIDFGYLSRLLKKFEHSKLITRSPSPHDARQSLVRLTLSGRKVIEPINKASHDEIADLLGLASADERKRLINAMHTIQSILDEKPNTNPPYTLRSQQVGDMGWITHRQGLLYQQEYGWDETYEALVAEITANFVKSYNPNKEKCWIAEQSGEIVGSVFVVQQSAKIAKLRLLYVEPSARCLGIGRRLVDECIQFSREKNYKNLTFWTNNVLVSARRVYEAAGFTLEAEEAHHSFGKDLIGQTWNIQL